MPFWLHGSPQLRWQDAADIGILAFALVLVYRWLRGTVAIQVALAIAVVFLGAWTTKQLGFALTSAALSALGAVSAVAVVVIFKDEIRRGLGRASLLGWWRARRAPRGSTESEAIAQAMFALAPRRKGALAVIPRQDDISPHLTGGSPIDALLTASLLEAIFAPDSPLHDGAAVIRSDRIVRAGAVLPLSSADLPDSFGTRHRAALGLTEISDAVVVCVSEERGEVSVAAGGTIEEVVDPVRLVAALASLSVGAEHDRKARTVAGGMRWGGSRGQRRIADLFAYLAILVGVGGAWSAKVLDRSQSVARPVALEFRGLNDRIGFEPPADDSVVVELRGPRRQLDLLPSGRITAFVDLSHATPGRHVFPVSATAPDGIQVSSAIPASIELQVLERRSLPIGLAGGDRLAPGLRIVALVPSTVQLVGSSADFRGVHAVTTARLGQVSAPGNVEVDVTVPKGLRLVDSKQARVVAVVRYDNDRVR